MTELKTKFDKFFLNSELFLKKFTFNLHERSNLISFSFRLHNCIEEPINRSNQKYKTLDQLMHISQWHSSKLSKVTLQLFNSTKKWCDQNENFNLSTHVWEQLQLFPEEKIVMWWKEWKMQEDKKNGCPDVDQQSCSRSFRFSANTGFMRYYGK